MCRPAAAVRVCARGQRHVPAGLFPLQPSTRCHAPKKTAKKTTGAGYKLLPHRRVEQRAVGVQQRGVRVLLPLARLPGGAGRVGQQQAQQGRVKCAPLLIPRLHRQQRRLPRRQHRGRRRRRHCRRRCNAGDGEGGRPGQAALCQGREDLFRLPRRQRNSRLRAVVPRPLLLLAARWGAGTVVGWRCAAGLAGIAQRRGSAGATAAGGLGWRRRIAAMQACARASVGAICWSIRRGLCCCRTLLLPPPLGAAAAAAAVAVVLGARRGGGAGHTAPPPVVAAQALVAAAPLSLELVHLRVGGRHGTMHGRFIANWPRPAQLRCAWRRVGSVKKGR